MVALSLALGGCAKYQAKSAFEEAEELVKAEQYDQAVEKYFAATQDDPTNKIYKLKLIAGRTRAAAYHINKARALTKEDKFEQALAEYRLARGFDPSVEVAVLEARQVEQLLAAQQKLVEAVAAFEAKRYPETRKLVGEVLKADPENARANELLQLLGPKHQVVVMDGIELEVTSNEPITLHFKQANVKEVFNILSQLSGINFLLDDEVKDKPVTILLEKATFSQAMELLLQMAGLGKKVLNSKTMIIYTQNKDKEKQYEDQIIQTFFLSHIDAKKAVNLLRTMLQLRKVYVHEERNAIVVRDKPATIKLAEQVLLAADRENSEVLFDLELLAVGNTDALKFGPKLSQYSTKVGFSTLTLGAEDKITVIPDNTITSSLSGLQTLYTVPSVTFDFAKTLTDSEILASPKIRVRNNEKAKVHIGTREPVITVTTTGDTSTDNIQYVDVGVKVDVEPTIQLDRGVQTKLTLEVSQVIDRFTTSYGSVALTISTTNAQSVLTLKDGVQTIIGGLFEEDRKKTKTTFAFLGDIPLLGSLLTNFDDSDTKREILLSITPYIVKQIEVPEADVATIWSGGEDDLMARPKFGAFAQPLLSEVEEVTPAAAPAVRKSERPSPFSAIQG
jgi:general secretion pathway protein D